MARCFLDTSVTSSAMTLYIGDRRILSVTFVSTSFFRQFSSPDLVLVDDIICATLIEQRCLCERTLAGKSESVVLMVIVEQGRVHLPQLCTNIRLVATESTRVIS